MARMKLTIAATFGLYLALYIVEKLQSGEGFALLPVLVDLVEVGLLAGAVWMTAVIAAEARVMRSERGEMLRDLSHARAEGDHWRAAARAHVEGLTKAISAQFAAWGLTGSEADVAALMLKGLSHKEIANLRGNSEATVRQHAATVYRKSGLANRTQLTAFFLEDLLPPQTAASVVALVRRGRGDE